MQGASQAHIAAELGVSRATVSGVVSGRARSRQVEERIAAILERPPEEIWPHWYGSEQMRGVTGLDPEERRIIERYRSLPRAERAALLDSLFARGATSAGGARDVIASGPGSMAAGRTISSTTITQRPARGAGASKTKSPEKRARKPKE